MLVEKRQPHPYLWDPMVTKKKKMGYRPQPTGQLSLRPIRWQAGDRSPSFFRSKPLAGYCRAFLAWRSGEGRKREEVRPGPKGQRIKSHGFAPLFFSFSALWGSDGTRRQMVIPCPGRSCCGGGGQVGLSTCPTPLPAANPSSRRWAESCHRGPVRLLCAQRCYNSSDNRPHFKTVRPHPDTPALARQSRPVPRQQPSALDLTSLTSILFLSM